MASSALKPIRRWSHKLKASLVEQIRLGVIEREEAKSFYGITEEELQEWESGDAGRRAMQVRDTWDRS